MAAREAFIGVGNRLRARVVGTGAGADAALAEKVTRTADVVETMAKSAIAGYNEISVGNPLTERLTPGTLSKFAKGMGVVVGAITSAKFLTWIPNVINWLGTGASYVPYIGKVFLGSNPITVVILTLILIIGKYDVLGIKTKLLTIQYRTNIQQAVEIALKNIGYTTKGYETAFNKAVEMLDAEGVTQLFGDDDKKSEKTLAIAARYKAFEPEIFWRSVADVTLVPPRGHKTGEETRLDHFDPLPGEGAAAGEGGGGGAGAVAGAGAAGAGAMGAHDQLQLSQQGSIWVAPGEGGTQGDEMVLGEDYSFPSYMNIVVDSQTGHDKGDLESLGMGKKSQTLRKPIKFRRPKTTADRATTTKDRVKKNREDKVASRRTTGGRINKRKTRKHKRSKRNHKKRKTRKRKTHKRKQHKRKTHKRKQHKR